MTKKSEQKKEIEPVALKDLHLNPDNPRFGMMAGKLSSEAAILDFIVEQFGVQDVLSSIAVNGYFSSEPVLARRKSPGGPLVVEEGNRRLVACLILAADPRAKNQKKRTQEFRKIHEQYGRPNYQPVPTIIFETPQEISSLLPYLGVRHIAGAQQWDSYAKAAWVAQAVEAKQLELEDVIQMIGDDTQLARRMLKAYYVVRQLEDKGYFDPSATKKKGTKSNTEFPFSWVYTALGFSTIGEWVKLPVEPKKNPLDKEGLQNAGRLFGWMFGQDEVEPAIKESREIKELAKAIGDPEGRRLLQSGNSIAEIERKTRPVTQQLSEGLTRAHDNLASVHTLLGEGSVSSGAASECLPLCQKVRSLAQRVYREVESAAGVVEDADA